MEIIYRAKDGKEFDDKYECEDYERSLCTHTFKMWDDEHKPLTDYSYDAYSKAMYVRVKDSTEIDDVRKEFNYYGFSHEGIDTPGFYCYIENYSESPWENAENIIDDYQKTIDNIKKMMESVDELNERDIL